MVEVVMPSGLYAKVGDIWFHVQPTAADLCFFVDRADRWLLVPLGAEVTLDAAEEAAVEADSEAGSPPSLATTTTR